MPLTALIVDDEDLARQELQFLLEDAGGVTVLGQAANGVEAIELARELRPDVIFLDVRMPGLDGFAVLKKLLAADRKSRPPQVVFATAFDQYAVKAFEVNAVDYLLKPFDSRRLVRTLDKVRERLALSASDPAIPAAAAETASSDASIAHRVAGAEAKLDALLRMIETQSPATVAPARSGKVVMRSANRFLLVDGKDVCFATIAGGTITVATRNGHGEANCRTLEELADQLDPEEFWRAHRSFLVNIHHIREVVPWFHSSFQLRMDDKDSTEVPVSRSQTKRLRELFNL
jgi:two-component system response regulator LytT